MTLFKPSRRDMLGAFALTCGTLAVSPIRAAAGGEPESDPLNEEAVLRDPAVPVGGNPKGDISLVEWSDYRCPYCRKLAPDLRSLVAADGKLRMVFKDWPILGPESVYAAQLALATRYQNKYLAAHEALMTGTGRITEATARDRLAAAKIDVDRAVGDMVTHKDDIAAVLKRNNDQAEAFGFNATPSFIIGKFRVPGTLTIAQFKLAIADARTAAKTKPAPTPRGEKI